MLLQGKNGFPRIIIKIRRSIDVCKWLKYDTGTGGKQIKCLLNPTLLSVMTHYNHNANIK